MNTHQPDFSLESITDTLKGLSLGGIRFFSSTSSTNTDALTWATKGAPDESLVLSDSQSQGRGRFERRWFTPAGSALACSFIFRPQPTEIPNLALFTAIGALAVCHMVENFTSEQPSIKWPNDVLIHSKKVAGILTETAWQDNQPVALVLGIGVNILPASVPKDAPLLYPSACLQDYCPEPVSRLSALRSLAKALLELRPLMSNKTSLIQAWNNRLAFIGQRVKFIRVGLVPLQGVFLGIDDEGSALLQLDDGNIQAMMAGDLSLRLSES